MLGAECLVLSAWCKRQKQKALCLAHCFTPYALPVARCLLPAACHFLPAARCLSFLARGTAFWFVTGIRFRDMQKRTLALYKKRAKRGKMLLFTRKNIFWIFFALCSRCPSKRNYPFDKPTKNADLSGPSINEAATRRGKRNT